MKLLVDMSLTPQWVAFLSGNGFAAQHWSSLGNAKAPDSEIMDFAREQGFVVFTHDLDFGHLLAATNAKGPSVIQVRTQDPTPVGVGHIVVLALRSRRPTPPRSVGYRRALHDALQSAPAVPYRRLAMRRKRRFSATRSAEPWFRCRKAKREITIRIHDDVLNWFRDQVNAAGDGNYQTIINHVLREYIESRDVVSLEKTLRRVIREELRKRGAA